MDKVECPYCGKEQYIDHDDGYGYGDDLYEQECGGCGKKFVYTTGVIYVYHVKKADCLNGAEHEFKRTSTIPECTAMLRCKHCGKEKPYEGWQEKIDEYFKDLTKKKEKKFAGKVKTYFRLKGSIPMDWCPYVNDMKVGSNGCQDKCVHCLGHGSDEEGGCET